MHDQRLKPVVTATCRSHSICTRGISPGRFLQNKTGSAAIVLYYILFGLCWIFFSDVLLSKLATDTAVYSAVSIAKGWMFIAITALLLYLLINRRVRMVSQLRLEHEGEIGERERRITHANRLYAVLSSVNRSVIRISEQQELLDEICRIMVDTGGFEMAWIGWPGTDGWIVPRASSGDELGYLDSIRISVLDIPEGRGPTGMAIRERKPVVCDNIATNPAMAIWRKAALQNGFSSSACFPFALPDGSIAGLTIYSPEPDFFFDDKERLLLSEIADDMEYALHMLQASAAHRVAEQEKRELERQNLLLSQALRQNPASILITDSSGIIQYANPRVMELTGYQPEELVGQSPRIFKSGKTPPETYSALWDALLGKKIWNGTLLNRKKNGGLFWEQASIAPVIDDAGNVTNFVAVKEDISERIQRDNELKHKNAELESFTYSVSHDLKSPLVTFKAFLGYLKEDIAKDDREMVTRDIGFMEVAANRMERLLSGLLSLSRVGQIVNEPTDISFRELVDESLATMAGHIAQQGVSVKVLPGDVQLRGDSMRLQEIWQNLLENAVKYMGDQPEPQIWIGAEQSGADTVFFVRDNGMGIDKKFFEKIFELFEKLDATRDGIGIGLALVKKIVLVYGGRIWVESDGIGKGSCFKFTLPHALIQE
jgi:PAS domain S-box-containing protein